MHIVKVLVDRTSEDHSLAVHLTFNFAPRRVEHNADFRVVQHATYHGGVAVFRHTLIGILKITIILGYQDRHTGGYKRR